MLHAGIVKKVADNYACGIDPIAVSGSCANLRDSRCGEQMLVVSGICSRC